jgi:hypothetical protein
LKDKTLKPKRSPEYPDKKLLDFLRKCKLIGIHGPTGSGKTLLSKELIQKIGGTHIEIDKIPSSENGKTGFINQINLPILKRRIQNGNPPIIIDCYLLLDILKTIDVQIEAILLCERVDDGDMGFRADLDFEFESYKKRYDPRASARQVFTMTYSR